MSPADRSDRASQRGQGVRLAMLGRSPRRTLARGALLAAAAYVAFGVLFTPVRGQGVSMQPTLEHGQFAFVNRAAYWWASPARGDIVALRLAGPSVLYIKRIVALPGERVAIASGVVLVNDRPLAEPYLAFRGDWKVDETRLDDREYLVIGDNRGMPVHEHDFGKAQRDRIVGRVAVW